jgi:hypothetical protein
MRFAHKLWRAVLRALRHLYVQLVGLGLLRIGDAAARIALYLR